jgi:hypothetical protein
MPKLTTKYKAALEVAKVEGLSASGEDLYKALADRLYFWNSDEQRWIVSNLEDAEPTSKVLRVRVWVDKKVVEDVSGDVVEAITQRLGMTLIEKSQVYICRPPKQLDGRVYLTFAFPEIKHG